MVRIILDTNVLVSGLLSPFGTCGEIARMLTSRDLTLCVDARIVLEYEEVLSRPKLAMDTAKVDSLMEYINHSALFFPTVPLDQPLPDPDDTPFLEVAVAAGADCLVTGNLKHYPKSCRAGIPVLSPAQFLKYFVTMK